MHELKAGEGCRRGPFSFVSFLFIADIWIVTAAKVLITLNAMLLSLSESHDSEQIKPYDMS